jgi:hypothetical protein
MGAWFRRVIAQQLVFGYREGHRQLVGSVELDSAASSALLGATDAAVPSRSMRLISALPLPSANLYALCGTWSAPEGGRPGAVWAHALLIRLDELGDMSALEALAQVLRRPTVETLTEYERPVSVEATAPRRPADPLILARLLAQATAPNNAPVVASTDLSLGEATLFALWNACWPALRQRLSFRTRERVKAGQNLGYLCVAHRVVGTWRPNNPATQTVAEAYTRSDWLYGIGQMHPRDSSPGIHEYLWQFGPETSPSLESLVALGELHDMMRRDDPTTVARTVVKNHPKVTEAASLKRALFGRSHARWWSAPELDVVVAIFRVGAKGFDLKAIDLASRVSELVAKGNDVELLAAWSENHSDRLRPLLAHALAAEATPRLLESVLSVDRALGEEIAAARPDLLEHTETWSGLTDDEASAVAHAATLSDRAIAAAVAAGRYLAVTPLASLPAVALRLLRGRDLHTARKILEQRVPSQLLRGADGDELRIEAAAAGVDTSPHAELLVALEARRDRVDEAWLRAAVSALARAGEEQQRPALEVVFGPLHHAVTDDRLPRDLWDTLDKLAPAATDPALRLRRMLITRAREEAWPRESLERSLRGSGPFVREFKAEVKGDSDDPFVAAAKAVLKTWKRLI